MQDKFRQMQLLEEQKFSLKLTAQQWETLKMQMLHFATQVPGPKELPFDNLHNCWKYTLASLVVKVNNKLQKNTKADLSIKISSAEYYAIKEMVGNIDNPQLQMYVHAITSLL